MGIAVRSPWCRTLLVACVVALAVMFAAESHAQVVINEIHYHPADPNPNAEFIELYNAGGTTVVIADWSLDAFPTPFVFPTGASIPAGEYVVVAQDAVILQAVTGFPDAYEWPVGGNLDNGGESIRLIDDNLFVVDEVHYLDNLPWPKAPDGTGPSLELIHPDIDNSQHGAWRASPGAHGTPGAPNDSLSDLPVVLTERPARGTAVTDLSTVSVTFSEPVEFVAAGDLTVDGSPATTVVCSTCDLGVGEGPYEFSGFTVPVVDDKVFVVLASGSIQDLDTNAFGGESWFQLPAVVLNELHYHPADSAVNIGAGEDPEDLQFLELYNNGTAAVDLSSWYFTGLTFSFPSQTTLGPGEFLVLAKNVPFLRENGPTIPVPVQVLQWTSGNLSNNGEAVRLFNASDDQVDRVEYGTGPPWPTEPDGGGPSLELIHPSIDNSEARAWTASAVTNGTPGDENGAYDDAPIVISESPPRGTVIGLLSQVSVTFHEPVTGVAAGDLTVNGSPATAIVCDSCVGGVGAGPYVFSGFAAPGVTPIPVNLAAGAIQDLDTNPFAGDSWLYQLFDLPAIVINEIHYHPADSAVGPTDNPEDLQFLELYNNDTVPVNLSDWAMVNGIGFVFPPGTTLDQDEYLVLAADAAFLKATVPIPPDVDVFTWDADTDLANSGERLTLVDSAGITIDDLTYGDAGNWPIAADGTGPSLELINPVLPNEFGASWKASLAINGTPGEENSEFNGSPAPIIFDVRHDPAIPGANTPVTITAHVVDDGPIPPSVTMFYRQDKDPTDPYSSALIMQDDGYGATGDGIYGAVLSGLPDGERYDFVIRAADSGGGVSIAPSGHDCDPTTDCAGVNPSQTYLCKFSDDTLNTDFPTYHLITTQYTRNQQGTPPPDQTEYDATFIQCDMSGIACDIFYNVIERYRGDSTLDDFPRSFRIEFSEAHPLPSEMGFDITRLNLMAQQTVRQELGYQMFDSLGDPVPKRQFVRLSTSPLADGGLQDYQGNQPPVYINVERVDSDFFSSQGGAVTPIRFPEGGGNAYRAHFYDQAPEPNRARLQYHDDNFDSYRADTNGGDGYAKVTNAEEDDWWDLIHLTDALNCSTTDGGSLCVEGDYSGSYADLVRERVDVDQWARWVAMHMVLNNQEGGIYRNTGDDYFLYMTPSHDGATFVPWDMDAIMGETYEDTIWRTQYTLRQFLINNAFAGIFVGAICDQLDGVFSQAQMDARIDALPDHLFPTGIPQGNGPQTKPLMKAWVADRRAAINNEIKRQTTLQGVPASSPSSPYLGIPPGNPFISLTGDLNQCHAASVVVNGQPANFIIANPDGSGAAWSHDFQLVPGVNNIEVQTLDHDGNEVDSTEATVYYAPPDSGGPTPDHLELTVPTRMVNTKTLTLKAEIRDSHDNIHWPSWHELGTVSARRFCGQEAVPTSITIFEEYDEGVGAGTPPADSIRFYNGVGSVSIVLDQPTSLAHEEEIEVIVTVGGLTASAVVTVLDETHPGLFKTLSGTLGDPDLQWGLGDGVIHLLGDVTVPAGKTLTINPDTLVMVNAGPDADGTKILVNDSAVNAVGSEAEPIFFFPEAVPAAMTLPQTLPAHNPSSWRGFEHRGTGTSLYSHVFVTGAGNGPIEPQGHPRPPVFHVYNTYELNMADCVVADSPGKVVQVEADGVVTIERNLWSRVGRGGEFLGNSDTVNIVDSWFTRIGRADPFVPGNLDGDVLSLHGSASTHTINRSVFADCGDDMIDVDNGANPVTNDSVFWNARSKCVSLATGTSVSLDNVLVFDVPIAIDGDGATITQSTIASDAFLGDPVAVDSSIIWPAAIPTGNCPGTIHYTLAGTPDHLTCGTGNLSADPLFQDRDGHDYSLQAASPAADADPTGGRIGWLGFPDGFTCNGSGCNDGNNCTTDACDTGACVFTPSAGCVPCTTALDCDDGDPCTTDTCPGGNFCSNLPDSFNDGLACNDGLECTDPDLCSGGICVGTSICSPGEYCDAACGCFIPEIQFTFQNDGVYGGTQDTFLAESQPGTVQGTLDSFEWDADEPAASGQQNFGLIRFDGIVGTGLDQIPQGSNIVSATLALTISDPGIPTAAGIHRSLVDWDQSVETWDSFGGEPGVQPDEYDPVPVAAAPYDPGTRFVDVTSAVQAWVDDPTTNFGLVIRPNSPDKVRAWSSEHAVQAERPVLSVVAEVFYCDDGGDCNDGEFCNGVEPCNFGTNRCEPGTPVVCDDNVWCTGDSCNESTDQCEYTLCSLMSVNAVGSRYLAVTPPHSLASVAIRVDSTTCGSMYVDASGNLTQQSVSQSSDVWGTVYVGDREIVPGVDYSVYAEVQGAEIDADSATTWSWGETDDVNDVNVFDILCVLDGVGGIFTNCTTYGLYAVDLMGFVPDGIVDDSDITAVLDAFQSLPYPDSDPCSSSAPPMAASTGPDDLDFTSGENAAVALTASTLVPFGATWSYLDDGSDQGKSWTAASFPDGDWATGPAELGFGDGDEATVVGCGCSIRPCTNTACSPKNITTYFRHTFPVNDVAVIDGLTLDVVRSTGVVVYLNGTEVCRDGMPIGPILFNTLASFRVSDRDTAKPLTCPPPDTSLLVDGTNVLAAELHLDAVTSPELSFDLELTAETRDELQDPPQPLSSPSRATGPTSKRVRERSDGYVAGPAYRPERTDGYLDPAADGEVFCELSRNPTSAGSSVTLWTFVKNPGALPGVRGYQTEIQITRTSGDGTVSVACPEGVQIDDTRTDYIFYGQTDVYPVTNCGSRRTASSLLSGSVVAGDADYLSEYKLDVSTDATVGSTFEISFAASPDTSLADVNGGPIPIQFGPTCVLTVGPCVVDDCDDQIDCTAESCENEACAYTPNGQCGVSGTVQYYRNHITGVEPSTKLTPDVGIDVDEDGVADATTDPSGDYGVGNLAGRVVVETLNKWDEDPVDPDRDFAITASDAGDIAEHILNPLSPNQQIAGDVSGNGFVTGYDAAQVLLFQVFQDNPEYTHFPVADITGSDWAFVRCDNYTDAGNHDCTGPIYVHDPLLASEDDDFYGILYGDVTGNWFPPSASPAEITEESTVTVVDRERAERLSAAMLDPEIMAWLQPGADRSPSDEAELELTGWSAPDDAGTHRRELVLEIREGDGIQAFDLQILFDPGKVEIVDVRAVDLTDDFALVTNDLGGDFRGVIYDVVPIMGSGAVLEITVDVKPGLGREFPLDIRVLANEVPIPVRVQGSDPLTRHPENSRRGGR